MNWMNKILRYSDANRQLEYKAVASVVIVLGCVCLKIFKVKDKQVGAMNSKKYNFQKLQFLRDLNHVEFCNLTDKMISMRLQDGSIINSGERPYLLMKKPINETSQLRQ